MTDGKRIVLVDDDARDVALTLSALEEIQLAGDVLVLRDGQQALDYLLRQGEYGNLEGGQPAVVLLDLKLPRVDGLEVLARVKSHAELRRIPVVMLTSSNEDVDLARSYNLGVNAYVVKPVEYADFVGRLKELGVFWATVNQPAPGTLLRIAG
jgi:CheY-like chemotaxis protein